MFSMKTLIILFLLYMSKLSASQKLVFGAISTVSPEVMQKHLSPLLRYYDYLARHDRVAKYVIFGKYDAGAIKESVAKKYALYLKIIAKSEPIPDFVIVVSSKMNKKLALKIQTALYNLKDPTILQSIKASAVGFIPRQDSDYNHLREIMHKISSY